MEIRCFLFLGRNSHDVHLHLLPGSVILLMPPTAELGGWKLCLLDFWLLISLLRVWKELGAQVYPSSILFENFANEARLYKMKFLIVRKFPTFFLLQNWTLSPPPLPIKFLQNGNSDILSALITNCCLTKEDQFGYIMLQWTCKTIYPWIVHRIWGNHLKNCFSSPSFWFDLIWHKSMYRTGSMMGPICWINALCFITKYCFVMGTADI